jgi:hypothetical protein
MISLLHVVHFSPSWLLDKRGPAPYFILGESAAQVCKGGNNLQPHYIDNNKLGQAFLLTTELSLVEAIPRFFFFWSCRNRVILSGSKDQIKIRVSDLACDATSDIDETNPPAVADLCQQSRL